MERGTILALDVLDVDECKRQLTGNKYDLVTADGAFDADHSTLESVHMPLCIAETDVALHCLAEGGVYVVKFFEGRETDTLVWIAMLSVCFSHVSIVKPFTSRATNSERYLVCTRFLREEYERNDLFRTFRLSHAVVVSDWIVHTKRVLTRLAHDQTTALHTVFDRVGCPLSSSMISPV